MIYSEENMPIHLYFSQWYSLGGKPLINNNPYIKSDDPYENATLAIEHMLETPVMRDQLIAAQCPLTAHKILHGELTQQQRAGFEKALDMLHDEIYKPQRWQNYLKDHGY